MLVKKELKIIICIALIAALVIPQSVWAASSFTLTSSAKSQLTVYVKKGTSLKLRGKFISNGDTIRSYTSSKKTVATVSSQGTVKGKKVGTTTITAKTKKGKTDTIKVSVVKNTTKIKRINIPSTKPLNLGSEIRLPITSSPSKITNPLSWSSSDTQIAVVDSSGYVTAKHPGTAVITVKAGSVKDTCKVTVNDPVTISNTFKSQRLDAGAFTLNASAASGEITWVSSDEEIAKVNSYGEVTPITYGAIDIIAKTVNDTSAVCKVQIVGHVSATAISLSDTSKTIGKKNKYTLSAKLTSSDSGIESNDAIQWVSSNTDVATVNSDGQVTATGCGTATISAIAESLPESPATCKITVITIKTKYPSVSMVKGAKKTLKNTTYGLSASPKISWTSSKTSVATVSSKGVVTAKNAGTTVVTAKSPDGDTTKSTVKVEDNPVIVDVSKWQGNINWATASKHVDLAILRVQYGTNATIEPKYSRNAAYCKKYKIPFGAYSYALYKTKSQANKEATLLYKRAFSGTKKPTFLVVDAEESYITRANTRVYINKLRAMAQRDGIKRLKVGLYVGHHLYTKLNLDCTRDASDRATPDFVWIPRYGSKNDGKLSTSVKPKYKCDLWQYSSGGKVPGMSGRIDMNTLYDTKYNKLSSNSWFDIKWLSTSST